MKVELSRSFRKVLEKRMNGYEFEVGILKDGPHKEPIDQGLFGVPQTRTYAGGPVRKLSRNISEKTTGQIFVDNQKRLNINLLLEPFQKKNSDILKFTKAFMQMAISQRMNMKRVENLLQAIVRNPILRKEYGSNNATTADNKGFDRHLFDTGQMFRAIVARVKRV